ncbi:hypothetical protein C8Q72DRAFT_789312 [Fomitopsis betulina]|nr:hypothetical protein C8Q72DRAFT_789312 [Fomitopsis betulina]
MITVVVEPTNCLELDLAASVREKGLTSVIINTEMLATAIRSGRDLWREAREGQHQIIALTPESLASPHFNAMINDPQFHQRWGVLVVDEAHLVSEWGADFRKAYTAIWTLRARAPAHTVYCATSEPECTDDELTSIGSRRLSLPSGASGCLE